jgi:hypothetical protein
MRNSRELVDIAVYGDTTRKDPTVTSAILQFCSVVITVSLTAMVATGSVWVVCMLIRAIIGKDTN